MNTMDILFYSFGTMFFFSVLAFAYYTFKNAQLMRGPLGHQLMAIGGILFLGATVVGVVDHFLFPGSGLVYVEFAIWVVGLLSIISGGMLRAKRISNTHQASIPWILKIAPNAHIYLIAIAGLVLVSLPLSTLSLLSPIRTEPSWCNVANILIWALAFTAMAMAERNLHPAVRQPEAAPARTAHRHTLLRHDLLALRIYAHLTGQVSATLLPMIGIRSLRHVLRECRADHRILEDCGFTNEGTIATDKAADTLGRMAEAEGLSVVLDAFSCLLSRLIELCAAVTSDEFVSRLMTRSYRQTRSRYGDSRVLPQVLETIPEGFLEEERLALLSKEQLEVQVKERTREVEEALAQAKRAAEALQASKASFHSIVERSTDGIVIIDRSRGVRFANPAACSFFDHDQERMSELFGFPDAVDHNREVNILRADGERGVAELSVVKTEWEGEGAYLALLRDITEHKQMETNLRRRARELAALQATVLELTVEHDLPTLLETIVERAVQLLGAQAGGMYLCDPEREEACCVVSYNTPDDYKGTVLKYGEGAAGTVAETGRPLIIEDYRSWGRRAATYEDDQPFTAVLSAPMIWQGVVTGVIHVLHDAETRQFTQTDLELLSMLANHAAIAVESTRLHEETERRESQARLIYEVGQHVSSELEPDVLLSTIVSAVRDAFDYHSVLLLLLDQETARLTLQSIAGGYVDLFSDDLSLALGEGMVGHAAVTGQIQISNDVSTNPHYVRKTEEDTRSELAVPIVSGNRVIGVLDLQEDELDAFDKLDVATMETLSTQIATAIENAHLFQAERKRSAQLATVSQVAESIAATLDVHNVLHRTVELITRAFGYYYAAIMLVDAEAGDLVFEAGAGGFAGRTPSDFRQRLREGMIGWVAHLGETLLANDVSQEPRFIPAYLVETQSELDVPLKHRDRVIGVLSLQSRELNAFDEHDVMAMEALAGHIAAAIENARLYEEVRRQADELTTAVDQLKELDRLKSEFIQNVSHELRSPLALIRGYAEMIESGELGGVNSLQKEPIAIISRRAQMLSALVQDITLILEAEVSPPTPQPVPLDELARAAVLDFQISASEAELRLQTEIAADLSPVRGAPTHLRRVLDNLIENAIKFTPAEGTITVRVRQPEENHVLLEVSDTGIGIRSDQQERIFERFYQIDGSSKRRYRGTGLGLALVKEIVETYGGKISVESEEGQGSTFTVALPVFEMDQAQAPTGDEDLSSPGLPGAANPAAE